MFHKTFRVKSSTHLKVSERKRLLSELEKEFPSARDKKIQKVLFPNKETVSANKIVTHSGATVTVYCVQNLPIVFEVENILYPTVYMSWKFMGAEIIPTFKTISQVCVKLSGGADLMLPGIILDDIPVTIHSYGKLKKGDRVNVNTTTNKAAIAVGQAALSSEDMYMSARHGKGVKILHVVGDKLCTQWGSMEMPELGPPSSEEEETEQTEEQTDEAGEQSELLELEEKLVLESPVEPESSLASTDEDVLTEANEELDLSLKDPQFVMSKLIEYCFLRVLVRQKISFPILASTFYKNYMIPACPMGYALDIKKSNYKKLSKFLSVMAAAGMIQVKELVKGVESIMSVNSAHTNLIEFVDKYDATPKSSNGPQGNGKKSASTAKPTDVYTVTAAVLPLMTDFDLKKGATMPMVEVRKYLTKYVKANQLQSATDPSQVVLNPVLRAICKSEPSVKEVSWPTLMNAVQNSMTHKFQVASNSAKKFEPIDIQVGSRSGNKKVTLVYNIELYGIDLQEFARKCQHGVAASTSISAAVHRKGNQLLIQGNQVYFVGKLLQEQYEIPIRYIRGMEKAIKPK